MEINRIINEFFLQFSGRCNENALSDVIAATCNVSKAFKKLFLDFFYPCENLIDICTSAIERESYSEDGKVRFDLYFSTNNKKEYIIENKIFNTDDHYNEYIKYIPEKQIGFIANYNVSAIKYKNKHTWTEFVSYIKNNLDFFDKDEKIFIEGILFFIREVCCIMDEKPFKLESLHDLGYFIELLSKVLSDSGFDINRKAKGSKEDRIGFWCYKKSRSYWFGVYLNNEGAYGYSIWGGIYNYDIKGSKHLDYTDFHKEYKTDNSKWFKLKKEYLEKLSENLSFREKYKILESFIKEVEGVKQ